MKLFFTGNGTTPVRGCDLCLRPMRYLGGHVGCRLFRCDDCALVVTTQIALARPEEAAPPAIRPPRWSLSRTRS